MKYIFSVLLFSTLPADQAALAAAAAQPQKPVSCQVSEWGEWKDDMLSACGSGMHMSLQTRLRTVLRPPGSGAAACPALSETREVHIMCGSADAPKIALPPRGTDVYTTLRVRDTEETVGKDPKRYGAFRGFCSYSHMAYDDPIVFPGSPGASHLHVFFGNTSIDANSTLQSMGAGGSTCRGGTANRSSYWVPAMIDTGLNAAVIPAEIITYYKDGFFNPATSPINKPPNGLKMVAGNPVTFDREITWKGHPNLNELHHNFECWSDKLPNGRSGKMQHIPAGCPVGGEILFEVSFPQCWDGKNLDSPDHRSHMAYPVPTKPCPADHPVPIVSIAFNIHIPVREGNDTSKWRLASDGYDASIPGGYSAHGDVIVDWDEDIKEAWFQGCIKSGADCHGHMLGDNRMVY